MTSRGARLWSPGRPGRRSPRAPGPGRGWGYAPLNADGGPDFAAVARLPVGHPVGPHQRATDLRHLFADGLVLRPGTDEPAL